MKKSQMLNFLFWTLVALIIFIPTLLWATKFLKIRDKPLESYFELVQTINSLDRDGEGDSLPLHMNPDYLIVGFSKNADKVQAGISVSEFFIDFGDRVQIEMNRFPQCEKGKSCLCLCRGGVELTNNEKFLICSENVICNQFEKIDFFENRPLFDAPIISGTPENRFWKNGFFFTNTRDNKILQKIFAVRGAGNLNFNNPTPIYVQRYKNLVNVCYDRNCITNEMIDKSNKEEVLKEFQRFKEFYLGCKYNADCGTFSLNLPERYYIYYEDAFIYDELRLINTENLNLDYLKDNFKDITVKDEEDDEVAFDATIYKDDKEKTEHDNKIIPSSLEMKKEDDKIIFKIT